MDDIERVGRKTLTAQQYYGPSLLQLAHLFTLASANSIVLLMLTILLLRTLYQLALNMTTIESWEMERHEVLVRRARSRGGFLDGPDGEQIRIRKQEFPYDVGVMRNIGWGMGSFNVGVTLSPFFFLGYFPGSWLPLFSYECFAD